MSGSGPDAGITRRAALQRMAVGAAGLAGAGWGVLGQQPGSGIRLEKQETGSDVWQVTTEEFAQSNIYCEVPYCSADSGYFVYQRGNREADPSNTTEFMRVEIGTWKQEPLGSAATLAGCAVTPDGKFYYCKNADGGKLQLVRADIGTRQREVVHEFEPGPRTWSFGTVSPDHRYYARGNRLDDEWKMFGILLVDLETGEETVIDRDPYTFNAHPQFDPGSGRQVMVQHNRGGEFDADGKMLHSTGPEGATLFLLSVPEGKRTLLPVGKPHTTPCTGHEAWAGTTGEMILTVSATDDYAPEKGNLLGVRATGPARVVARGYRFAHVGVSRCGRLFSCDDWQGAYKIVIGSVKTGKTAVVCDSKSQPDRSQATHPHPYLTPDLKWVIFNSNRSGHPHVHAASVPEGVVEELVAE